MRITIMVLAAGVAFVVFAGAGTIVQDIWAAAEMSFTGNAPADSPEAVNSSTLSRFYPMMSYLFYILPMAPFILGVWYMLRR